MTFTLSANINPPTTFLARFSEISDRLDPAMVLYKRRVNNFKYDRRTLRSLLSEAPEYGAGERGIERTSIEQPRYIRITDIDEFGILSSDLGATAGVVEPRYLLNENDLLIARSGNTVGKSYLHKREHAPYSCFFAGYLIRFRFDHRQVSPEYVFALTQLPFYKEWVEAIQRPAGQPNINAQEYANLEIPVPPEGIQLEIIKRLQEAYSLKRSKDARAWRELETIDDLLLSELGISLPPEPPSTIENRIFKRSIIQVTDGRFDPASNWKSLDLRSKRYPRKRFADVVRINPSTAFHGLQPDDEVSFVPMESVDDTFGRIDGNETRALKHLGSYTPFQEGDLIWAKITPCMENGKSAVASNLKNRFGFGSTEFHVFRPKVDNLSVKYLHALLRLKTIRDHARLFFTGSSGHQRVDERFFNLLSIPLPPRRIQENICDMIQKKKSEARKLRGEATMHLEKSKKEIEQLVLNPRLPA